MLIAFELLGSLGIAKILSLSVAMTGAQAPISWSPDSRWICYTVAEPRATVSVASVWIFDGGNSATTVATDSVASNAPVGRDANVFRIWATQVASPQASALLEESDDPLGSPSWRPDGGAVAFIRFSPKERDGRRLR